MEMFSYKITVAILATLLQLVASRPASQPASQPDTLWHVRPTHIAFRNEIIRPENEDANCAPIDTAVVDGPEEGDYIRCSHPTRITDSDKSLPIFTQDTPNTVYIWGHQADQLLFTFSSRKRIDSITLHYYSNEDSQGLPKLRFYAVPDDFEVWDSVGTACPSQVIDEARPGSEETGLRNRSSEVQFETTKLLLTKGMSKNYQLFLSEVEFFTSDPDSVDVATTTASTTIATTASPTTTASESETTTEILDVVDVEVQALISGGLGGILSGGLDLGLSFNGQQAVQQSVLSVILMALVGLLNILR